MGKIKTTMLKNRSGEWIAVDALAISEKSAGSFTVLMGLMEELLKQSDWTFCFFVVSKDIERKMGDGGGRIHYHYVPGWSRVFLGRMIWQQVVMPRQALRRSCLLIYSASGYPVMTRKLPVISHQQNLWSFASPQDWWPRKNKIKSFFRRQIAKVALKTSTANIYISDFLRDCANIMVPGSVKKNVTVSNAVNEIALGNIEVVEDKWVREKYCVAVGSLTIQKNYLNLVEAFGRASQQIDDLLLVIVGDYGNEYGASVQKRVQDLKLEKKVVLTGALPFSKILYLYKNALFSVNVSRLEGFGLPVLESMRMECPVICSDCDVYREIGGQGVLYCDPNDPIDISQKIQNLYGNNQLHTDLKGNGLEKSLEFSWNNSARKMVALFEKVLRES